MSSKNNIAQKGILEYLKNQRWKTFKTNGRPSNGFRKLAEMLSKDVYMGILEIENH